MIKRFVPALLVAVVIVLAAFAASGPPPADGHRETAVANKQDAAPPGPRPNFVFVLTDDLAWNLVSHMPRVLALERAGSMMSKYYVVDSLCCPSRAAIFTGEYPHDDGVFTNAGSDGGICPAYDRTEIPRSHSRLPCRKPATAPP